MALDHNGRKLSQAYETMLVEEGMVDERPLLRMEEGASYTPGTSPASVGSKYGRSPHQRFLQV